MLVKGAYLILGNWKMHGDADSAVDLAAEIARNALPAEETGVSVGVAPSFLHIGAVRQAIPGNEILLGAQDCRAEDSGAFTGDISAAMLKAAGCAFVIAGHSERRKWHGERDEHVRHKAGGIIRQGMHAVVCVGETQAERDAGTFLQAVEAQLRGSLPQPFMRDLVTVSYEPVWAIGTGRAASAADIRQMHAHIRTVLQQMAGAGGSDGANSIPRVLYGGSVNANNALDILSLPVVDGVLVGGASLDANAFQAIIHAAHTAAQKR